MTSQAGKEEFLPGMTVAHLYLFPMSMMLAVGG